MIVDVRLVVRRDGSIAVLVEGRVARGIGGSSPSAALALLARRLEGAAWAQRRDELAELGDERSALYSDEPPAIPPAPTDEEAAP